MGTQESDILPARTAASPLDYIRGYCQYLYPQHLLSAWMFRATRIRYRPFKDWQIRWFIRRYDVDMSIAAEPDPKAYPDFNSFFTRALRLGARPIASEANSIVSPADGEISQIGEITNGRLLQAKGREYALDRLLGGKHRRSLPFSNGTFLTIYLAPRDYHRVHMPIAGGLREMVYIPGQLFSVNPCTTRVVPGLFTRNERVVFIFETPMGPMALVMVGAVCVGSIETPWAGMLTPTRHRRIRTWHYEPLTHPPVELAQGQEMGRFNMGSTVIVLFPAGAMTWNREIHHGQPVVMGQQVGIASHKNTIR